MAEYDNSNNGNMFGGGLLKPQPLKPLLVSPFGGGFNQQQNNGAQSRGASPSPKQEDMAPGGKRTPAEVLSQMHDISGTITELMHENVYLRTKLLSAKAVTWKAMFVSLDAAGFGLAGIFSQWHIFAKNQTQERLNQKHRNEQMGWADDAEKRFNDLQSQNDLQLVILQAKLDKAQRERDEFETGLGAKVGLLEKQLDTERLKNKCFQKAFHCVHDQLSKAATEFLDDHGHTVDTAQFNVHHPEHDGPGQVPEKEEEKHVNEFLVEQLHEILHTVDGRYVRPLSVGLPKRNVNGKRIEKHGTGAGGVPSANGGGRAANGHGAAGTPLLGKRSTAGIAPINLPPVEFTFQTEGVPVRVAPGTAPQTQLNPAAAPAAAAAPAGAKSRVLLIEHALKYEAGTTQPEEFGDVLDDMEMGCGEYAKPVSAKIVKPEHVTQLAAHGIDWVKPGWVFAEFKNDLESEKVYAEMQDGDYDGQILKLTYYDQEKFKALLPLLQA